MISLPETTLASETKRPAIQALRDDLCVLSARDNGCCLRRQTDRQASSEVRDDETPLIDRLVSSSLTRRVVVTIFPLFSQALPDNPSQNRPCQIANKCVEGGTTRRNPQDSPASRIRMMNTRRFTNRFWLRSTVVFAFTFLHGDIFAADFRAGAAAVDVTPLEFPVVVNGMFQTRTATRAHDRLMSRAIVLDDGSVKLAIVVVDNLMIPRDLLDAAKSDAEQATGIPVDRMLISATHTHSAPSVMGCLGSGIDAEYRDFLPEQIVKSIVLANQNLQPARFGRAVVKDVPHNHCRRWIFRPDRMNTDPFGVRNVRAHMHPGYQSQNHIGPSGPADQDLTLLSFQTRDGQPLAVLANFAMHYFGSPLVSGDFCGRFGAAFSRLIGSPPSFVGIMSQGTSGDSMWPDYSKPANSPGLDGYTLAMAQVAHESWKTIEYRDDISLAMAETTLKLRRRVADDERMAWAREIMKTVGDQEPQGMAQVYAREQIYIHDAPEAELKLQAIRIGDAGITALPDEVYGITGLKLKLQSPLAVTCNIELANGAEGYIPPPEQHEFGGYTTWAARTAGLEADAEPKIVATLLDLLEKVSGRPRIEFRDPENDFSRTVAVSKPIGFWRLGDIVGSQATDALGRHHGEYEAGVAFYLPGLSAPGMDAGARGNRTAHFAGGRVRLPLKGVGHTYSFECWFWNGLPNDARAVTGYFFSRGPDGDKAAAGDHLGIGGTHKGEWAGRLIFFNGNKRDDVVVGQSTIPPKTWNHVAMIRSGDHVSVYLNGSPQPDIEGECVSTVPDDCDEAFIGGRSDNLFNFEGKVDEAAVYDRELSTNEVVAHFAASGANQPVVQPDPPPSSPEESLGMLHVRDGFVAELVAAEPLVIDPVAIDWGPDGTLWVVEMADYPSGIDGNGKPGGRVRRVEDSDGDGRYDRSTVFLEDLNFPTGILVWNNGVLVTAAPEIIFAEDTNADGKADKRETLYSGFLEGNQQLRVNGLRWGLDNWIYCASGSHHSGYGKDSQILSHRTGQKTAVGSRDFRIRPDTQTIDPQSGPSQHGRNCDDWGNWFGVQNSHPLWHYVLEDHYIRRNPHYAPPDPKRQIITPQSPRVYPAKTPQKRFHGFDQAGRFTSACSAIIYRDELLFAREPGSMHSFTCEPFHNLVQHNIITDDGVSFDFHRDPAESDVDFFASRDRWCRPVMARTGPDGALWVVDMYRYMIEHPQWLPQNGKDELRPFFRSGDDRGRIYRIFPKDHPPTTVPRFDRMEPAELVRVLESSNGWQRDLAQRLLLSKRDDAEVVTALKSLFSSSQQPLARLHVVYTLDGLHALESSIVAAAIGDAHPEVRRHGVRLSASIGVDVALLVPLVRDSSAKVRLQLANTLGDYSDAAAAQALVELAAGNANDAYIMAAVQGSISGQNLESLFNAVLKNAAGNYEAATRVLLKQLLRQAAAYKQEQLILNAIDLAVSNLDGQQTSQRFDLLADILDAVETFPSRGAGFFEDHLRDDHRKALTERLSDAHHSLNDDDVPATDRVAAVRLLLRSPEDETSDISLIVELLQPQKPVELHRAVVHHVSRYASASIAESLLAGWRSHSPALRSQVLDTIASRTTWVEVLATKLESKAIAPTTIDPVARQRLLTIKNAELHDRLSKLFASVTAGDRQQVIAAWKPALELSGDITRGEKVFRKICATCHRHAQIGVEVGAGLAGLTNKSRESLLTSILDPSRMIEAKYLNYVAVTTAGRSFSGILATETGSSITLLAAEGKRTTILRNELEDLVSTAKSMMPEGLEKDLTPQDLADVMEFVAKATDPPKVSGD